MGRVSCEVAIEPRTIADAQRVRWQVYAEEERLLPARAGEGRHQIDARDVDDGTIHLVAYVDGQPAGTVRLLEGRRGTPTASHFGLDLEDKFDLRDFAAADIVPAEVTRYCVMRRYRGAGVAMALHAALQVVSRSRGITHWVAAANMQTDFEDDAALAYRLLRARGLTDSVLRAWPRAATARPIAPHRPFYTDGQRAQARSGDSRGLPIPPILALFAMRLGARYVGAPAYDGHFNVFALPLVVTLRRNSICTSPPRSLFPMSEES
jgi:L-ornithine Nalpha-acyltransferase